MKWGNEVLLKKMKNKKKNYITARVFFTSLNSLPLSCCSLFVVFFFFINNNNNNKKNKRSVNLTCGEAVRISRPWSASNDRHTCCHGRMKTSRSLHSRRSAPTVILTGIFRFLFFFWYTHIQRERASWLFPFWKYRVCVLIHQTKRTHDWHLKG